MSPSLRQLKHVNMQTRVSSTLGPKGLSSQKLDGSDKFLPVLSASISGMNFALGIRDLIHDERAWAVILLSSSALTGFFAIISQISLIEKLDQKNK